MSLTSHHLAVEVDLPVTADLLFAAFPEQGASVFVLDGAGASSNPRLDQFTFMGAEPIASFRAVRRRAPDARGRMAIERDERGRARADVFVEVNGRRERLDPGDPFALLGRFLAAHAPPPGTLDERLPFPFRAGLVGYIGYEAGQLIEHLPCAPRPFVAMPDVAFAVYDWVLANHRDTGRTWLSVLGRGASAELAQKSAASTRDRVLEALARARAAAGSPPPISPRSTPASNGAHEVQARATLDRSSYLARIEAAKRHIHAGDASEICLTKAHSAAFDRGAARALYLELRRANPSPFAALLDLPEGAVVSSSPERFVSLDARGFAESRPIKGTRPRGATPEEDARAARDLARSEKDREENAMAVDVVLHDLARVCRLGSVEVPERFAVESYATVHQLVSTVRGQLAPGKGAIDLVRACFPPASMTGAPKVEAMSILEQLEPVERGVYSGALGWLDFDGAMDLSVVIRALIVRGGEAWWSTGGAIIASSDPAAEHDEAEHKGRALVRALSAVY